MADPSAAVEMLQQIKSLGIRLAIDDFGTGYSSLSYLHRFPLDTLKIDRSFISVMEDDGEGMEIARSIVPMANNLRLDVVAEGVETIQQVALLRKLQCKYGQGYYFSRPLSAEGIAALLAGEPYVASVRANQVAQQTTVRGEHERGTPLCRRGKFRLLNLHTHSLNCSIDQLL